MICFGIVTMIPSAILFFRFLGIILIIASLVLFICKKKGWGFFFLIVGLLSILYAWYGSIPRWE